MDYTMLIDRILEAEQSAREIAQGVKEQQENLGAELEAQTQAIREKYMDRAKARLEALEAREREKGERRIAAQDARLAEAEQKMERAYARYGDNWENTLFRQTIDIQ